MEAYEDGARFCWRVATIKQLLDLLCTCLGIERLLVLQQHFVVQAVVVLFEEQVQALVK